VATKWLALAAAVVAAFTAATASDAQARSGALLGCGGLKEYPFASWLDVSPYTFVPNGGFESGASGWQLGGGAKVVVGNEPFRVHAPTDGYSLQLPPGSSATTPRVCAPLVLPTLRFFATGGVLLSNMAVDVVYTDVSGATRVLPAVSLVPGPRSWSPTLPVVHTGLLADALTLDRETTLVSFRFRPVGVLGSGTWRIDDIYVDPWLSD